MERANRAETKPTVGYRAGRGRVLGRIGALAGMGGAGLVAVLMMMAPATSAMITNGTNTAPYTNTHLLQSTYASVYGCAKAGTKKGVFAPATGIGKNKANAVATTCSFPGFSSSSGYAGSTSDVAFDTAVSSTASYTIDINWTATVREFVRTTQSGMCPAATVVGTTYTYSSCYVSAYASAYIDAWVVDMTNGTYYYGAFWTIAYNSTYNSTYSYCYSGSCYWSNYSSGTNNGSTTGTFTGDLMVMPYYPLDSTHAYDIYVEVSASASVYVSSYNNQGLTGFAGAGIAKANLGSLGNQWMINWISVT